MSGYRPWLKYGIAGGKPPWPYIDSAKALPCAEHKTWLVLAPVQADAVRLALSSKVSVITGGWELGKRPARSGQWVPRGSMGSSSKARISKCW